MTSPTRRLAAIMFTDIVGYTALMAESEEKGLRARERHRALVRPLVEQYHGESIEARGDESLSTFPTALDAVNCALAIEEAVRDDAELKLHVGIHLGDVVVQDGEVSGDGVNIASRICALSEGGGIWVSGEVHRSIRNQPGIEATALGEQDLKNVPEPVAVYAVSGTAAPPRPISRAVLERPAATDESALKALTGRPDVAVFVVPAVWVVYVAIVFEILFMISPLALYYYSSYGPSLNFLHGSPWAAWLTQFFLPHFSQTTSPVLNSIRPAAQLLTVGGLLLFFVGFVQLYWAKLQRREAVIGGMYRWARHPQYLALAILGLGTLLWWPRFLVLISYVTMLFLYAFLARFEEQRCLRRFGASYREYMGRTGMFLPGRLLQRLPSLLPASGGRRVAAALALYMAVTAVALGMAYRLRDYSLAHVSAVYEENLAALSPAVLTDEEVATAVRVAIGSAQVRDRLDAVGRDAKLLVYVVPVDWELPDLPIETIERLRGHYMPSDFDRGLYKVLFTRVRAHDPGIRGEAIVKQAYGRDPIVLVRVNNETGEITAIETPPPHVLWGDIPTPMF